MAAEQIQDSQANIKVEKQPNGQVRIVIEGLSIAGNMMDVEEGVLQYLKSGWLLRAGISRRWLGPLAC